MLCECLRLIEWSVQLKRHFKRFTQSADQHKLNCEFASNQQSQNKSKIQKFHGQREYPAKIFNVNCTEKILRFYDTLKITI